MSESITEVENKIFEHLKSFYCKPVINVLNVNPNVRLKDVLSNPSYVEEKLDIIIWTICKYEPHMAEEFDLDAKTDEKCRRIMDALTVLGMVEYNELTAEKLQSGGVKVYREIVRILDFLIELVLLTNKYTSQSTLDDFLSPDMSLSVIGGPQSTHNENWFEELYKRRMEIFDDPNYINEYRNVMGMSTTSQSLIPKDMIRVIKALNENNPYYVDKSLKAEQLAQAIQSQLTSVNSEKEQILSTLLNSSDNQNLLVEIEQETTDDETFAAKLKMPNANKYEQILEEISSLVNEFNKTIEMKGPEKINVPQTSNNFVFDILQDVDSKSQLESCMYEYTQVYDIYNKNSDNFIKWNTFLEQLKSNQKDYETNCELFKNNKLEKYMETLQEFNEQMQSCIDLVETNIINLDNNHKEPVDELKSLL